MKKTITIDKSSSYFEEYKKFLLKNKKEDIERLIELGEKIIVDYFELFGHAPFSEQIRALLIGKYSHFIPEDLHNLNYEIYVTVINNKEKPKVNSFTLNMNYEQIQSFDQVCRIKANNIFFKIEELKVV